MSDPKPTWEHRDRCGMCGQAKDAVPKLIVGLHTSVCSNCVRLCNDILGAGVVRSESNPLKVESSTELREQVCYANKKLVQLGLVTMHSGNVSAIDRESGVVFIKPSGMNYDEMAPKDMVAVSLEGEQIEQGLRPSVDLAHHLYLYRNIPDIGAIVHTHSNYATAFASCQRSVPVVLTAIADEFGGEIPCAPYVDNEGDNIGAAIVKHRNQAPAVLLGNHGVFAWGATVADALKAAAMTEDVAKTVAIAGMIGEPVPLSHEEVAKWNDRYLNRYGQK